MTDQNWASVARASRTALDYLGYGIKSGCLPDEAEPCGRGFADHAAAHLAAIKAVADHQLDHLGAPQGMLDDIYGHTMAELEHRDDVAQNTPPPPS